jgi:uncharacterized protein YggE
MVFKRKTVVISTAVVCLALVGLLAFQVASITPTTGFAAPLNQAARQITVVGEGKARISPDIAQVNIGVDIVAPTVKEASQQSREVMEKVQSALKDAGVEAQDIQTSSYNIYVERDYQGGDPQQVLSYHFSTTFMVTIRDVKKAGPVLDAAVEAGANNIYGVTFTVDDPNKAQAEARAKAVKDAGAKAQELAKLTKVKVGQVIAVSEVIGYGLPGVGYETAAMGMGGGGAGPVEPGQLEYTVQIQVTYAIE